MKISVCIGKLLFVLLFVTIGACQGGNLRKNFYRHSCPEAEDIIRNLTWSHVATNPILPAKFLRMHFHDCFVRGCDGSILIDSTNSSIAEKDSVPNLSLAGFDVIEDIKAAVEDACPGIVSCADILALVARDSVSFQFQTPLWKVRTGRRDGNVSLASEVFSNIPSPFSNFSTLKQDFNNKNLTVHDLVVLSGGHTIGVANCGRFSNRLYNFTRVGDQDPSLNATYAAFLKTQCQSLNDTITTVELDPGSSFTFDKDYYDILQENKGLLQSDAALLTTKISRNIVKELTNSTKFFTEFAQSMIRMGAIEVLTGTQGEIRNKCNVINPKSGNDVASSLFSSF